MLKVKKIKDNIHGYIYYSGLEQLFISHPLVLRMHYIRQNGGAYLTYPSIRVHRYEHSLGAMHLCGTILLNSVKFSSDDSINNTIKDVVTKICGGGSLNNIRMSLKRTAVNGDLSSITDDGLYRYHSIYEIENDEILSLLLLYQGARIAMLVHDIGHPPFSHTIEMALKQLDLGYEDHERVGLELLDLILDDIQEEGANEIYMFAQYVAKIVKSIVDKTDLNHKSIQGVAAIVSGDFDADRLDYVKRDALAGGLSTNSYDVGRLLDAVKLTSSQDKKGIEIKYFAQALSTMESFFSMRFHMYRWMLWHHSVILQNMNLVSIVHELSKLCKVHVAYLSDIAESIIHLGVKKDRRADYWYFTDALILNKLAEVYLYLKARPEQIAANLRLFSGIELLLFRKKGYIVPFWKTPDVYVEFAETVIMHYKVETRDVNPAVIFNVLLSAKYKYMVNINKKKIERGELSASSDNIDFHSHEFCRALELAVNAALPAGSGTIRAYYLAKFKPAPEGMHLISEGVSRELGVLSPSIPALEVAWQSLPHLWIFLDRCLGVRVDKHRTKATLSPATPRTLRPEIAPALAEFLRIGEAV